MAYKVIIAPHAAKEIVDIMEWYANISPDIADKWRNGILEHIVTLEKYPKRCLQLYEESQILKKDIRQIIYGKQRGQYRIMFEIGKDTVNIISIRHAYRQ